MRGKPQGALLTACALAGSVIAHAAVAQNLSAVIAAEENRIEQAQRAQDQIDEIAETTRERFDEYQIVLRELEGVRVYNDLQQAYIDEQERQLADLRASIDSVTVIERQVLPLMTRMLDSLELFISLDVPFLLDERTATVERLRKLLLRSDVSAAEQFRNVMQAWQTENDYGRTAEPYKGELEIGGVLREVDFLKLGRIGLYYVTPDNAIAGAWDQRTREWVALTPADAQSIRAGINIFDTGTPELFMVPIAPPQEN